VDFTVADVHLIMFVAWKSDTSASMVQPSEKEELLRRRSGFFAELHPDKEVLKAAMVRFISAICT
jgi:hypothetical protein